MVMSALKEGVPLAEHLEAANLKFFSASGTHGWHWCRTSSPRCKRRSRGEPDAGVNATVHVPASNPQI